MFAHREYCALRYLRNFLRVRNLTKFRGCLRRKNIFEILHEHRENLDWYYIKNAMRRNALYFICFQTLTMTTYEETNFYLMVDISSLCQPLFASTLNIDKRDSDAARKERNRHRSPILVRTDCGKQE